VVDFQRFGGRAHRLVMVHNPIEVYKSFRIRGKSGEIRNLHRASENPAGVIELWMATA